MNELYLETPADLAEFCDQARAQGRIGIDTEFHRERRYYPQLALVQLAVEGREALLDPLVEGVDLAPLGQVLGDPAVVKILHAPDQDLEIFYLRFGEVPRGVFDTQTAAAMLGLGAQVSLAGLVDGVLGVRLTKGQSFTDWLRRPLSEAQERYAAEDVRYLLALHDSLVERLGALGRVAWLDEELRRFESAERYDPPSDTLYRKVKRYRSLEPSRLAVLRELAIWREERARARDRNRRAIAADEVLLEIARSRPRDAKTLSRTRGLGADVASHQGDAILAAVARGQAMTEDQWPRLSSGRPPGDSAELSASIVQAFLKVHCQEVSIDPTLVGTSADVERLVSEFTAGKLDPANSPLLQGWRGELVGEQVLAFLRGELSVRLDPDTARPRFEPVAT